MAQNKINKLELTWIGKEDEPLAIEPRLLLETPEYSFGEVETGTLPNGKPWPGNMLIHGDNLLALRALEENFTGTVKCIYIDPPYNSRQYSRFYHVYETLVKWDKPVLHGVARKPEAENMSEYCRKGASETFADLVRKLRCKCLVVSYNNTYASKSKSSENKITLEQIQKTLESVGETKVYSRK